MKNLLMRFCKRMAKIRIFISIAMDFSLICVNLVQNLAKYYNFSKNPLTFLFTF